MRWVEKDRIIFLIKTRVLGRAMRDFFPAAHLVQLVSRVLSLRQWFQSAWIDFHAHTHTHTHKPIRFSSILLRNCSFHPNAAIFRIKITSSLNASCPVILQFPQFFFKILIHPRTDMQLTAFNFQPLQHYARRNEATAEHFY